MLQFSAVMTLLQYFVTPIGPALVLFIGAFVILGLGHWVRRPVWLTGLALFFVGLAVWLFLGLRTEPVVPTFSLPWQPPLQAGANLLWVGDGWNWYISGLILLLGGVGILLDLNIPPPDDGAQDRQAHASLAIHLGVLGAGLLFVGSGNVLTAMLTWVVLDLITLVRGAVHGDEDRGEEGENDPGWNAPQHQAKGLSLIGALLLLIGLLPAGPSGPSQPLFGGQLPPETIALMLLASLIRAGIYPFHLWLLPTSGQRVNVAERLLDHMVPVLCGLWLLGWTVDLGAQYIVLQPDILFILIIALICSALAGWTAGDQPNHTTFVLITSAGLAALSGALAFRPGPAGLIWPTTAFALGGGLWLVGNQVWQTWGWQLPVSVGALALAGVPFTPGFLTQPSLSRLLIEGSIFLVLMVGLVLGQSIQVAAMLRSWNAVAPDRNLTLRSGVTLRLMFAVVALAIPLAVVGFFPAATASLAGLENAIPPMLGNPPSVIADWRVLLTVALPLALGIALVSNQPEIWRQLGPWTYRISQVTRLQWLFSALWWGISQVSNGWGGVLRLVEGAGYMGWVLVFFLFTFLLIQ